MREIADLDALTGLSAVEEANVEVVFLNVGQGDATLVVDHGSASALVIDCPAGQEHVVEDALDERSCRLSMAIITHWDLDHFGGILGVLDRCDAVSLRYNHDTLLAHGKQARILAALRRLRDPRYAHIEFGDAKQGLTGEMGRIRYELLAPSHRQLTEAVSSFDRNLASGVVAIEANGTRVLVGGDADGRVWSRVIADGGSLRSDVFKWPHHGALRHTNATDDDQLLKAVEPSLVIFSMGTRNRYGHPLPSTVQLLTQQGVEIMCTQVTARCHSLLGSDSVPCAGSVSVMLTPGGVMNTAPSSATLSALIDGWTQPLCRHHKHDSREK